MRRKLSVLRACRRVLRPGGRIVFQTIQPTPGLPPRLRRRANRVGPPAGAVPTSYESLLRTAGFGDIVAVDQTAEYRATQRHWIDAAIRYEPGLRAAIGDEAYDERRSNRQATLEAIDAGLLARFRYSARR